MTDKVSILVVENSPLDGKLLQVILNTGPYEVELIADGKLACERIVNAAPTDIVITDVNLPGVNGIDLTKFIRANQNWREVPVIALSSSMEQKTVLALRTAGVSGIISKPYSPERLQMEVMKLTGYERIEV